MNTNPPVTYEGQLADRVADLLPGIGTEERLELLGVMDPDDMRQALAAVISLNPQLFDFALVGDRKMAVRLQERLDEAYQDEWEEPYCSVCDASIGIFHGRGDARLHFTGAGTVESPVELFNADHEPVIAWRPAVTR